VLYVPLLVLFVILFKCVGVRAIRAQCGQYFYCLPIIALLVHRAIADFHALGRSIAAGADLLPENFLG
jgi:hypothetical protein